VADRTVAPSTMRLTVVEFVVAAAVPPTRKLMYRLEIVKVGDVRVPVAAPPPWKEFSRRCPE
jgi:hypothetical protein